MKPYLQKLIMEEHKLNLAVAERKQVNPVVATFTFCWIVRQNQRKKLKNIH